MKYPDQFTVEAHLSDQTLETRIVPNGGGKEDDVHFFYLLKDGGVHERSASWQVGRDYRFDVEQSGLYSVQAHVRRDGENLMRFSAPALYLDPEDDSAFASFIDDLPRAHEVVGREVFRPTYPYDDFVLFSSHSAIREDRNVQSFARTHELYRHEGLSSERNVFLAGAKADDRSWHFSGSMWSGDRLLFGSEDVETSRMAKILQEEPTGNHTYALATSSGAIRCGTDYFGIAKLFCLEAEGSVIVSNNYHLLLIAARALQLDLTVDRDRARSSLVFATIQPFHQVVSGQMDVDGIRLLDVDEEIVVDSGTVRRERTSLRAMLCEPEAFDEALYDELLHEAVDEIRTNVRAVLGHPAFEHVICDLTGGMDSRMVFGAVSGLSDQRDKVRIHSHFSPAEPDDVVVAQELNSFYSYPYDDLDRQYDIIDSFPLAAQSWSYNLGTYYSYVPLTSANRIPSAARLNGFYGEICARPYYGRRMLNTQFDVDEPENFVERYFAHHQKTALVDDPDALLTLRRIFTDRLEELPGRSALEKLDNHYLFYRNGLHCSDRFRTKISCPEFGPIQSKSLTRAKVMSYQKFKGAKVQFDALNLLNPVLANVRYDKAFDNDEFARLKREKMLLGPEWSKRMQLPTAIPESGLDEAKARIRVEVVADRDSQNRHGDLSRTFEKDHMEMGLAFVGELHKCEILSTRIARSLWYVLTRPPGQALGAATRWNIVNRLASLTIQHRIVSGAFDTNPAYDEQPSQSAVVSDDQGR